MVKITSKGDMNVKNVAAAEKGSTVTQTNTEGQADNRTPLRKILDAIAAFPGMGWLK